MGHLGGFPVAVDGHHHDPVRPFRQVAEHLLGLGHRHFLYGGRDDIALAANELTTTTGARKVVAIGLRLGATLATLARPATLGRDPKAIREAGYGLRVRTEYQ